MLCLTKDGLPKSMLLIANILAYSVMSFHASPNPVKSIWSYNSFWLSYFLFPVVALPLLHSCLIGLGTNKAGMMFAVVISPTAVHFGRGICFALQFLRQTSVSPFLSFNTLYNLAMALLSEYPITGLTTTLMHFECVKSNLQCSLPHWSWMSELWLPLWCRFYPLTLQDHIWEHSGPSQYSFWKLQCWGCTCFQVSPACCNSFSVIVRTKCLITLVTICTCTLS